MTESLRMQRLLLGCVVLCTANLAAAQVFTNKREAEHFEALVTPDQLVVRERYQGASTIYGDLSCPLGPAVKAVILPPGTDGRLCFHFLKDKCEYTRFQNGEPVHKEELANAVQPRMCIALASGQEAKQLAAVVNVGPRPREQTGIGSTGSPATPAVATAAPASAATGAESAPLPEPQQSKAEPPKTEGTLKSAGVETRSAGVETVKPTAETAPKPQTAAGPAAREAAPSRRNSDDAKEASNRQSASSQSKGSAASPGKTVTHGYTASGKWVTESFVVGPGGNRRMAERTYASAFLLDDKPGRPAGRYLYIRNKSNKHLLFYGLGEGPQSKLDPGAETVITLAYGPVAQAQANQTTVTLLWFDRH